jgi:hypothetical protein
MEVQTTRTDRAAIVRATTVFNQALVDIKSGLLDIPQLPLELAFVEASTPAVAQPPVAELPAPSMPAAKPPAPTAKKSYEATPAVASEQAPPVVAAGQADFDITVETVRSCFTQILTEIEQKNKIMAEALRNQAQLHRVSGREIQFITSELMKQRFEKPQPQSAINDTFSRAVGQPVVVRFLADTTVSKPQNEQAEDQNLAALVKTAEELGGEIVE